MRILSFDVASKSLAISIISFDDNWEISLNNIKTSFRLIKTGDMTAKEVCQHVLTYIDKLEALLDNMIVPELFDVIDLIPGKKLKDTTPVLRSNRLYSYLNYLDIYLSAMYTDIKYKVLLEYQMGPNDKSRNVCSQIMYHYSQYDKGFKNTCQAINNIQQHDRIQYDVEIVGPSLKNKINLVSDKPHQYFIQKYANR